MTLICWTIRLSPSLRLPAAAKTATLSRILSPRSILHFMMVTSVRSGPSAQGAEKQRDFLLAL